MHLSFSTLKKIIVKYKCTPEQLIFYITNRCNMSCRHCFYWNKLNTSPDPTLEEINKISCNIGKFNFLTLTGGEPFLRNDLYEIVTMFAENNKLYRISIPTNGYLTQQIVSTTQKILEKVRHTKILVKVSFDGYGKDHEFIRQKSGSFKKAFEALRELKELEKDYENFTAGIIMTMCSINQDYLSEAYSRIKQELNPSVAAVNLIRGEVKEELLKNVEPGRYLDLCKLVLNDFKSSTDSSFQNAFYWSYKRHLYRLVRNTVEKTVRLIPCYAGKLFGIIDSNLEIYPCELLRLSFGNLRDYNYNFREIWFSKKAYEIKKRISNGECFCTNECNLQINMFFNPKLAARLFLSLLGYKLRIL